MSGEETNISSLVEECHWGPLHGPCFTPGCLLTQPHLDIITDTSHGGLPLLVHSTLILSNPPNNSLSEISLPHFPGEIPKHLVILYEP